MSEGQDKYKRTNIWQPMVAMKPKHPARDGGRGAVLAGNRKSGNSSSRKNGKSVNLEEQNNI